jgi:hypothetical protein
MLLITHFALGMVIGYYSDSIIIVVLLSILSHFILDAIPHWDPRIEDPKGESRAFRRSSWRAQIWKLKRQIFFVTVFHMLVIFSLIMLVKKEQDLFLILLGGLSASLPDIYEWIAIFLKLPSVHFFKHRHVSWKKGIALQAAITFICLLPFIF